MFIPYMKKYISSPDGVAKMGPFTILALSLSFVAMGFYPYLHNYGNHSGMGIIAYLKLMNLEFIAATMVAPVVLWALLIYTYKGRMLGVTLTDTEVIIDGLRKPAAINIADIATMAQPSPRDLMMARYTGSRTKNSIWGFVGPFYHKDYGPMQWYCTKRKNYVLLTTTANNKIVLTVDDHYDFMHSLLQLQPGIKEI